MLTSRFTNEVLEHLLFTQSLEGIFFMMLDEPVDWHKAADKEKVLDYVFEHQRVTEINEAMLLQYGATYSDFIGKTPRDFFSHDLEYGRQVWRKFFDQGRLRIDTSERKFTGEQMWIEGDYICLYDNQERIMGHFGIQREVTERQKKEETLIKLNEAKDRIVATVAHDLRNPINAILGLVELMDMEYDNIKEYTQMISDSGKRALRIIQELLEIAEMESEGYQLITEIVNPNLIGEQLYERFAEEAKQKNINFQLVPCDSCVNVRLNREKFSRVLENLLSNALKFTPAQRSVRLIIESFEGKVSFVIKDEGIGIPETMREILFDKFTKAKRLGLKGEKTTGLGMYIVKQIIDLHKGSIEVRSVEGEGTEFSVILNNLSD